MIAAVAPIVITLLSLLLRLINLATPKGYIFDEVYYVDGARDFLKYGVEVAGNKPEFIVHPPVGKWLIASGIKIFGDNEFGWRIAVAICGTLLILLFARLVHILFYSPLLTAIGAALMSMDGLELVHSRTALLDLFLTFFVLLAVYLWQRERHWWAAISIGLALGTKWSAVYFLAIIALVSLYRVFSAHSGKNLVKPTLKKIIQYGLLPVTVYTTTWTGWFLSTRGWDRQWSSNVIASWWHYHVEILGFHTGLTEKHSYQANPWSWMIMGRPTSFFYDSPKACGVKDCAQEVLAIGTPILWWLGTLAIVVTLGFWLRSLVLKKSDPALNLIFLGISAGYLPWFFFQKRTVFTFYAIIIEPFMLLAVVYCAKLILDSTMKSGYSQAIVAAAVIVIFLNFIYFLPLFTGEVITYDAWFKRMWLSSWI
ncbi:MAG: phospholipid carrier-dependent glycosyltransferase [Streptomycetaceae bacterium]|jgi:dolichyl-phosphate-mannose--protein O-mannosyl transferase|nr:MAG: phospholipid carrier-dependent glycosyltransferase [Streptomycetaceae bacterium]